MPLYVIATTDDPAVILNASGIFLFGFTYLYVGITNLWGFDTSGLGWYCLWMSIIAIVYSLFNLFYFDNPVFGVIWLAWSFLWGLFFMLLALKRGIIRNPIEGPRVPGGSTANARFVIFLRSIYGQHGLSVWRTISSVHPRAPSRPSPCPARCSRRPAAGQDDEQRGK